MHVSGADLIDGTPILDVKPYIGQYDSPASEDASNSSSSHTAAPWVASPPISSLSVTFTPEAEKEIAELSSSEHMSFLGSGDLRKAIVSILSADPRSAYRRKKCADRLYFFNVDCAHVTCWFNEDVAQVLRVKLRSETDQVSSPEEQ